MVFCYQTTVPPTISSQCTLQEYGNLNDSGDPDDRFDVRFRFAVPPVLDKRPFSFATDIYARETPPRPAAPEEPAEP